SNTVMVGIPVLTQAFGDDGLMIGFLLVGLHLPIMMMLSALLIEFGELRDGTRTGRLNLVAVFLRVGRNLVRNPLVIGTACGVLFRLTGLPLTGIPRELVDSIAELAIPLALISLGMSLRGYGISGNVRPALVLGTLKLLVMPAIVYVLAVHVFALSPLATAGAIIFAACPTGANAYLIAGRFQTGLALSANTITLTTAASMVTFTLWLAVLGV
ncbi:MAG: AEC family transporter, partial [Pseudomonadota bacterium]